MVLKFPFQFRSQWARAVSSLVIVLLVVPFFAFGQNSISNDLSAAAAAEREGNYAGAVAYYGRVLDKLQGQPAQMGVRVQMAKDYFLLRRYEDSLSVLKPALAQTPGEQSRFGAGAKLVAGMDELELNQLPSAIEYLRAALGVDPQSGTARLALGDAYARSGRLKDAAREYRTQLRRTPEVADAWYKLGVVYSKLSAETVQEFDQQYPDNPIVSQLHAERLLASGDSAAALRLLIPILRARLDQPDVRADIGTALLNLGRARVAAHEFQAELSQDPESPAALLGLAEAEALQRNWQAVFNPVIHLIRFHPRELRQALEVPPPKTLRQNWQLSRVPERWADSAPGKLISGWLQNSTTGIDLVSQSSDTCASTNVSTDSPATALGIWLTDGCYRMLSSALEARRHLSDTALAKLAETEFRLGNYDRARAEASILAGRQRSNGWAAYWLARSYDALAYQCFEKLASATHGSPRVQEMLAQMDAARFKWTRAEKEYQSALRLAPGLPDLHLGLGTVYWQAGDWAQAEPELTTTLKLDPASQVASYELGDCYVEQHRWATAIPYLQRALTDPDVSYRARLDLSQAQAETGDGRGAIQELLPVANEDHDGVLHYRLALLYRKFGDSVRARKALARSQELRHASARAAQQQIDSAEGDLQKLPMSPQSARP
jgi:tetratricopeptide (TPR) repeat protein